MLEVQYFVCFALSFESHGRITLSLSSVKKLQTISQFVQVVYSLISQPNYWSALQLSSVMCCLNHDLTSECAREFEKDVEK